MTALIIFAAIAPWAGLFLAIQGERLAHKRSFKRFIETGEL